MGAPDPAVGASRELTPSPPLVLTTPQPCSSHWPTMGAAAHRPPRARRSTPRPLPGPATCWGCLQPCSHPAAWRGEPPGGWEIRGRRASLGVALVNSVEPSVYWGLGSPHIGQDPPPPAPTPSPFSIEIDQKLQEIMKQTGYLTIGGQVT